MDVIQWGSCMPIYYNWLSTRALVWQWQKYLSLLSDLDRRIEDDQETMERESETYQHYEEEVKLLEKQYGQNTKNIQRWITVSICEVE